MISFETTTVEHDLITEIAERAVRAARQSNIAYEFCDAMMDITAAHANGCRLRLKDLLNADDFNFAHDVFGIRRHLDRSTGALGDNFSPRFSVRYAEAVWPST